MWQRLALAFVLVGSQPAQAAFHLWDVAEVFSSEDGSVQFVELFTTAPNEIFLTDHTLRTRQAGSDLATFTIPGDLAGNTSNRRLLFATPGFEAAAGIAPDFTLPDGFLEIGVADEVAFDVVSFFPIEALPSNGVDSLNTGGVVAANSPTNFAGHVGFVVPEPGELAGGAAALAWLALRRGRAAAG